MKSILMSINPKWVAKILNGEKTIEIRKRFPINYVGWVYIYCTKEDNLMKLSNFRNDKFVSGKEYDVTDFVYLNSGYDGKGKVVARFWCDKVEKIRSYLEPEQWYMTSDLGGSGLLEKSCLSFQELDDYLLSGCGYAIHITKLEILDKPKEISEFKPHCKYPTNRRLTRAPQSWCYIDI